MKALRYKLEAALVWLLFGLFRLLPLDAASALGGFIGRAIGPRLAASRKARRHIEQALPGADSAAIIRGMWDNLGRVFAEYPHLRQIARERAILVNEEQLYADHNRRRLYISSHSANWEICLIVAAQRSGTPMAGIYRAPNNPAVARMLEKARNPDHTIHHIAKSRSGARDIVRTLRDGADLGILIDQKYNEGIEAQFFGRPAMTSPAFVELAQKFDAAIIPVRIERLGGAHFRLTLHEELPHGGPIDKVIEQAHRLLEQWITERPEQWLWLHRRWKEDKDDKDDKDAKDEE